MSKIAYVQMPQNDMAQIEQIVREYNSDPARGLAHGVQKDAIQNGFGARILEKEREACKNWKFYFKLLNIKGRDALVFWDEGTFGLTGDLLNADEISERIASDTLTSDQRLGRFLARLVSGGNLGPGIFGRGKLIFQGASKIESILIDSKRSDDGLYIALDRRVIGNRLMQPDTPYCGKEAEKFISAQTGNVLKPLTMPGTRVTILDLDSEVVQAFKHSFASTPHLYRNSFARMIEETWWEIIHKFDASIFLKDTNKLMEVKLHEPLKSIAGASDGENGIRLHKKENIPITIGNKRYRIKELRLLVMPKPIEEEYREVWIQRKRMKIGRIYRYIDVHPKISQRLSGYITLEPELEELVEEAESPTHYGFNLTKAGVKQIRQVLQAELKEFESRLGLVPINEDAASQKKLLDSMREISEYAPELGLMTLESAGIKRTDAEILVTNFTLPVSGTLRVEYGDKVGPIGYTIVNTAQTALIGTFEVQASQSGSPPIQLYKKSCNLSVGGTCEVSVDAFDITRDKVQNGKPLDIAATYSDPDKGRVFAKAVRRLYVGTNPPEQQRSPIELSATCRFPHKGTRRVEVSDLIRSITVKATNTTPFDLRVHLTSSLRHLENRRTGRPTIPLSNLYEQKSILIEGQTNHTYYIDDIEITRDKFANVLDTIASTHERACDIFTTVRLVEDSEELGLPRRWTLDKLSIPFYLEVDPPGFNIFRDCKQSDMPEDGRASWYEGSAESGYTFFLNMGHYSYRFIQNRNDEAMLNQYHKEQMLKQAYLIAFENDIYKGPAADFKDKLITPDLPFREAIEIYDRVLGRALNALGRG